MNTIEDLKSKIEILFDECKANALCQVDTVQRAGADIVGDYRNTGGTWEIPKAFVCAYAEQMKWLYSKPQESREDKARIKNYYFMMGTWK